MVYPDDHFMRWIIKIALFAVCFYGVAKFCKKQTGSFTLSRISSQLKPEPRWDTLPLPPGELADLRQILNQPYTYLNKGAQSFVFASQDGNYVIKFFRHHHMSAPLWLRWNQKTVTKRHGKLYKDFDSYKLAFDNLREETGLLYLHLNKTTHLQQTLDLVDKLGIHHKVPLDQFEFLIQKRAKLVYPALQELMEKGQIEQAKEALTNIVQFLVHRSQMGIFDKDPDLNSNFGLIGTQVIQIDIGRFKHQKPQLNKDEITRITDNLHQWLMIKYPQLDVHLKNQIKSL
ncbi:MAG TPA: hypothetical protein PKW79_02165 [Rhabdochlamydiaceae bacterium]|nr:hypothetical protein [Rhabdochlamydiaceae bacterium]